MKVRPIMTKLSVNLNKVATLRNTRTIGIPDVAKAARIVLDAGAHGITLHPRPDERHIRPDDVYRVAELLDRYPDAELNIEGNPFHGLMEFAEQVRPAQCTLVPDEPDAFTSDHGWDIVRWEGELGEVVRRLHRLECRVSLFVDPEPEAIRRVAALGADRIELYTEPYAAVFAAGGEVTDSLELYAAAAQAALDAGLGVNAGHDLNLENLGPFLHRVPGVAEVSIGHALIADALEFGLADAVRRYLEIINAAGKE